VELRFVGSGDAFGSGGRFQTCLHVRSGASEFLIDCGTSSLIAMRRFGIDPAGVDLVLLSHLHGDHFGGLPFLVLDAQFRHRTRPLRLAGPPGLEARLRDAMEVLFPGSTRVQRSFILDFVELTDRVATAVGPVSVTPFEVVHGSGAPSFALRVAGDGKVIAYSGDTEWTDALLEVAGGADLFVCEAYFFEKKVKYHLDYRTLMAERPRLGCRRLILTHMSEDMLGRLPLPGVEWAEDGQRVVV
jgi:ribonuclease BN (tRNA processing enzyme)